MKFRMDWYISAKCIIRILIGIALNLWNLLGSINILTLLNSAIHEHWISLDLFVSVSFGSIYSFQGFKLCLWLNLFLSNFVLFSAIANGMIFLISFLDWSLLMYKNKLNFVCWFVFCNSLICLIVLIYFVVESSEFSMQIIMSSTIREHFATYFITCMPFI